MFANKRSLTIPQFMQRGAAKTATSSSSPSTPNGPPSKRARLSNGRSAPRTPGTPSDHEVIQAALAAEERKREEALEKAAELAGETKWILSFKEPRDGMRQEGMQVRTAGFGDIDKDDDDDDEGSEGERERPVRMQFGGGVKKEVCLRYWGATSKFFLC